MLYRLHMSLHTSWSAGETGGDKRSTFFFLFLPSKGIKLIWRLKFVALLLVHLLQDWVGFVNVVLGDLNETGLERSTFSWKWLTGSSSLCANLSVSRRRNPRGEQNRSVLRSIPAGLNAETRYVPTCVRADIHQDCWSSLWRSMSQNSPTNPELLNQAFVNSLRLLRTIDKIQTNNQFKKHFVNYSKKTLPSA